MKNDFFDCEFNSRKKVIEALCDNEILMQKVNDLFSLIYDCINKNNKVIFCGNGGSAADCQHIVAEFVVKIAKSRSSLPALSLTSNSSIITAIANDIDYNYIFTRQMESIGKENDILIGLSTSGSSSNIINCVEYANAHNIYTISITGNKKSILSDSAKFNLSIPTKNTQIIQEMYMIIFHSICLKLDNCFSRI